MVFSAQTPEQASSTFILQNNLDSFLEDGFLDPRMRDLHATATGQEALWVDIDLFRKEIHANSVKAFFGESLKLAESLVENCEHKLHSVVSKR
jgi:hypothetical protein